MGSGWRPRGRRLIAAPVVVLAVMAFAGAVLTESRPPSWLGWCPPWAAAAAGAGLAVLGTWLVAPWATRRREQTDQDRDAVDALGRYLGWSTRMPLLSEMDPLHLRVHEAIPLPGDQQRVGWPDAGVDPRLPSWVERDIANEDVRPWLRRAKAEGGFLVVVGNSSTGKTRLLYQLLGEQLGDWSVLAPDLEDGAGLVNSLSKATVKLPKSGLVVWLDELQRFLTGPYLTAGAPGLSAATVRKLLDAPTPVLLVGALWPEYARELRAEDSDQATGHRRPRYPAAADILRSDWRHEVTLHTFNHDERRRAARLAATDPRLADALAEQRFGVTEVLAGAPELIRRYEQTTASERAVVHAAADALRLGVSPPLPDDLLRATARTYLDHAEPDDAWYPTTRDALTAQQRSPVSLLLPLPDPGRRRNLGFTIPDYLLQHLIRQRATLVPAAATWDAMAEHISTLDDLGRVGHSAYYRRLGRIAGTLYRAAIAAGDPNARARLARLLEEQGRIEEAEQMWRDAIAAGDPGSRLGLAWLQVIRDRQDEADRVWQEAIAAGDPDALAWRALLLRWGDSPPLRVDQPFRDAIAAGDAAHIRLAEVLEQRARLEEPRLLELAYAEGRVAHAKEVWRDAIANAQLQLASLVEEQGRVGETEQVWRDAVAAGDPDARQLLGWLLLGQNRDGEAEQVWRDAVAAGDPQAHAWLALLLRGLGRDEEAEQVWQCNLQPELFQPRI